MQTEAFLRIRRAYPSESSYDVSLAQFKIFIDHILTPYAKKHGLGQISADKMKLTRDVVVDFFKTPRIPEVSELDTNAYLPKLFPSLHFSRRS